MTYSRDDRELRASPDFACSTAAHTLVRLNEGPTDWQVLCHTFSYERRLDTHLLALAEASKHEKDNPGHRCAINERSG